jgi:DNA-binding NarL/FixJ family response regulator
MAPDNEKLHQGATKRFHAFERTIASTVTAPIRTRILIADDHELVSRGIEQVLESDFDVVGMVANGRELLTEASRLRPDVVILDIAMPVLNGIEAAVRLRNSLPDVKLLFVTQQADHQYVQAAFRAGGNGYVVKQSAAREVREALNAVLAGDFYISPVLAKDLAPLTAKGENPGELFSADMTPREREVLQLVAEGKTGKEIAQSLGISLKTVEFHKHGIMEALGLRTTAELTRYALEHGIVAMQRLDGG